MKVKVLIKRSVSQYVEFEGEDEQLGFAIDNAVDKAELHDWTEEPTEEDLNIIYSEVIE